LPTRWAESSHFGFAILDFRLVAHRITLSALASTFGGIHLKKNPKSEYRNPKHIGVTIRHEARLEFSAFWSFEFVSSFEIRISFFASKSSDNFIRSG
jgi:hypothetical protein